MTRPSAIGRILLRRYEVVLHLGQGGMGSVYLARMEGAAGFAKPVVVKFIRRELLGDEHFERQFAREARILSRLRHPNIVNVVDFGEEPDGKIMVLEYVHGYDLAQWHKFLVNRGRGRLPLQQALYVGTRVLAPLHHVHTCRGPDGEPLNFVHRDVSLSNVLLSEEGQVLLADFGIAKSGEEVTEGSVGKFKGKTAYAAPELLRGEPASPSSDCYAVAVTLFKLLTARDPFPATLPAQAVYSILSEPAPRIRSIRPDIPEELDEVLARALAKDRDERFASAAELANALRPFLLMHDDEVAADLARAFRRDFPELAIEQEIASLAERDKAWTIAIRPTGHALSLSTASAHAEVTAQGPDSVLPSAARAAAQAGEGLPSTLPPPGRAEPLVEPPQHRKRMPRAWLAVLGAIAAGATTAAVIAMRPSPKAPPPTFVTVQSHEVASAVSEPPAAVPSAPTSGESALTQAVRAAQPGFHACFVEHVAQVEGAPQITLRFELPARARRARPSLEPDALRQTAIGQCLLKVAGDVEFPLQQTELIFRVPLTARVSAVE